MYPAYAGIIPLTCDELKDGANWNRVYESKQVRLVRTELNYVENMAAFRSIKDAGMDYYRFIATLDNRTTLICRSHDGRAS